MDVTMADLVVELYGRSIGTLTGSDWRTFDFAFERSAVPHLGIGSTTLSESVPVTLAPNRSRAPRRRNYFAELLPEAEILRAMADLIGVGTQDVPALLRHYGRDVAGAVQIFDPDAPGEPRTPRVTAVDRAQIHALLNDVRERPLGNSPISGKSSLAGVQDKIVLARIGDEWNQVHDGYPSSHILKPRVTRYPTVIYDEE